MITLERTKTLTVAFHGVDVSVTVNVPTAEEVESVFRSADAKTLKDSDVFKTFVTSVKSAEVTGWTAGIDASTVITQPGTFSLVNKVVGEITKLAVLSDDEKNS